ncbi:type-F conjugative transfer system pilin assembly protein TrbC [Pectobacterium aroidearum]|uniref:type-F conjugative transfer system pilin assembly protein TrbC n=1 Tax=Pectobacterium aroidearum TaxID=1201031 RepID=UPI0030160D7B
MKTRLICLLWLLTGGPVHATEQTENRQFLKKLDQQSQWLRDHPDRDLQAWAQAQVENNPLSAGDSAFLDSMVKQQQEQGRDAKEGAAYFVSFSIPEEGLRRMLGETHRYGIPAILRGMQDNDLKKTANTVLTLVRDGAPDGVQIDPTLFAKYAVRSVPSLVVFCEQGYDIIRGNLRLRQALEKISASGDCRLAAQKLLSFAHDEPPGKK